MTMGFKEPSKPRIEPLGDIPPNFAQDNGRWLVERAAGLFGVDGTKYALIHADDGVLWAIVNGNDLLYPTQSNWTPQLRSKTIQQCRIFGTTGELFIWREGEHQWRGRVVLEEPGAEYELIEEAQILYGDRVHLSQPAPPGFTAIYEATTGMRQIVPGLVTTSDFTRGCRMTLAVTHYLTADSHGQAGIYCSRLKDVNLTML
jgi:CRISPR-associated protein (TIGR03984 family)